MTADQNAKEQSLWQSYVQKARRYLFVELLHANDSPHRLSLGVAVGLFVAFTPTIPFQMVLCIFIAHVLRANKAVGIPVVWVTNPATLVPIYLPQYLLGCKMLGIQPADVSWSVLTGKGEGFWQYTESAWIFMLDIFEPLWLGSMIVALILSISGYFAIKAVICRYRMKRYGSLYVPTAK